MEQSSSPPVRRSARLLNARGRTLASRGSPASAESKLLQLPAEIRLLIYPHALLVERPFLIGRVQERPNYSRLDSPRDYFYQRDESRNRPVQPGITRTCRLIRYEALPIFYSLNRFWLIHNEFQFNGYEYQPDDGVIHPSIQPDDGEHPSPIALALERGFDAWMLQTPAKYFEYMQHISLCGYTYWPTRVMITIDLKARKLVETRVYSTYGDNLLPTAEGWELYMNELVREKLEDQQADCKTVLQSILSQQDWIYQLSPQIINAPPGLSSTRLPMAGWEYDW